MVVDGTSVLPVDVWGAVESVEACRLGLFQIVRPGRVTDRLVVRVGYQNTPLARLRAVRDEVAGAIEAAVGLEPRVELVPVPELLAQGPPHKIPRVVPR